MDLLKQLLIRQNVDGDMFVVAALRYWCRDYEYKLGELLASLLSTRYPQTSPNKRKRTTAKQNSNSNMPTGEQLLGHLNQLRQHCNSSSELQIYQCEEMQRALQQAQAASSDSQRKNYGDLFAMAEVNEENEPPPQKFSQSVGRKTVTSKASSKKPQTSTREKPVSKRPPPRERYISDDSEESSEVSYRKKMWNELKNLSWFF